MPLTTYTAGEVLTAASLNANLSFAAGSGGLQFITSATVTAQTTLTVSNVFTATYLNYFMTYTNVTTASGANIALQFATGGSANSTTNYSQGAWRVAYNAGAGNAGGFAINQTSYAAIITDTSLTPSHGNMYFYGPQATQGTGINSFSAGGNQSNFMAGIFTATTAFDGITLTSAQNITGTFRFYGIVNS
jgi:hypothetical protein